MRIHIESSLKISGRRQSRCKTIFAGFYFLTSITDGKGIFVAHLSPSVTSIDLKSIATQLKDKYGIRGGGSGNFLQGGASQFDAQLKDDLKNLIK